MHYRKPIMNLHNLQREYKSNLNFISRFIFKDFFKIGILYITYTILFIFKV